MQRESDRFRVTFTIKSVPELKGLNVGPRSVTLAQNEP